MVKDTAFYELFASYKVPNHEQVGYWVDLKSNPRGEVIRVYNNNTRSWTKITEALPDIVNGSAFKSKREDGTYRETGLYDDPGDVSGIITELSASFKEGEAVNKISQELYDKIINLAKEHGKYTEATQLYIYDSFTTTNLFDSLGGDCLVKIIVGKDDVVVIYNANVTPYRNVEFFAVFNIDVNLHLTVTQEANGVITQGIMNLDNSGDGTKYLNDAGEYETVNEVYVGSVEPTGNEEIWINPDEDYNLSSIGLVEEAPLDNKLHARKNGQWVEFVENNTDLSSFATKTDLETKVDEAPTDDKQYARKNGQWSEVTSEGVYIGDTEPTGNQNVWIDPSDDSIDINAIPEAPVDNKPYVRKDGEWVTVSPLMNEECGKIVIDAINNQTITQDDFDKLKNASMDTNALAAGSLFCEGYVEGIGISQIFIVNVEQGFAVYVHVQMAGTSNVVSKMVQVVNIKNDLTVEVIGGEMLNLTSSGDGTKFLADNGEYLAISKNADTLDNIDSSGFVRSFGDIGANNRKANCIGYTYSTNEHGSPVSGGLITASMTGDYGCQIVGGYGGNKVYYRGINKSKFLPWRRFVLYEDINEDLLTYGVKWEVNGTNPVLTRIGNSSMHQTLPIQSKMRGCTLADDGTVNHYFNNDWTANTDGTPIVKDGSDGMVMIEIPEHYVKYEVVDGYNTIRLSEIALAGYTKVDKQYISAYEATVDRTDSTKFKLASVVNNSVEFRGGNNNAAWDSGENTLLGKPLTTTSRADFRTYARNRGNENEYYWNMYDFIAHNILYTLYIVEYANLNSQLAVNNTLTSNGYKQGGLGNGITNLNGTAWNTFNNYNPVVPCGYSDSLGNNSGEVAYTMPASYGTLTTYVNRYRGVENPFGHIWKNTDGIIFDIKTDADGGTSTIYIATNPEKYKDSVDEGYTAIGELPRTEGYGKSLYLGTFFPSATGSSSTTGLCDYFYTNISSSSLRTCLLGGHAHHGANAGFASVSSYDSVGTAYVTIGSRLIFRK